MAHRITRTLITTFALTLIFASLAHAQNVQPWASWPPSTPRSDTFRGAMALGPTQGKLFVVTIAHPKQKQTCRIQSFKEDQLVCSRSRGRAPIVYRAQDVAALITPGEHTNVVAWFLGYVGVGAGAITGAVFLASVTIIGAVPVAIAGGFILLMAPLTGMFADDDCPDTVLYLAPGQQLQVKLLP